MNFAKEIQKVRKNKAQQKFSNWHDHTSVIFYVERLKKENERLKQQLEKSRMAFIQFFEDGIITASRIGELLDMNAPEYREFLRFKKNKELK